jgi:hypothetical protein
MRRRAFKKAIALPTLVQMPNAKGKVPALRESSSTI